MDDVGIALGGGGPVGVAWELGVLIGLAEAGSFDANRARVILGTSAGSIVGALVRRGRSPQELAAWVTEPGSAPPLQPDPTAMVELMQLMAVEHPGADVTRKAAELALRARTPPVEPLVAAIRQGLGGADWPAADLRITAVDCESCQIKVWTAADGVGLDRAVTSSIAVPGIIGPVPIDGRRYMDGGMRSPSNADLLEGSGIGRAVFIGPIAGQAELGPAGARLLDERVRLEAAGIPLHVIGPSKDFLPLLADLMNPAHQRLALELGQADGRAAVAGLQAFLLA